MALSVQSCTASLCRCARELRRCWSCRDGDKAKADRLATRLGEELVSMRGRPVRGWSSRESR